MKKIIAIALCLATLCFSLASCTAGDKIKDTAVDVWGTAVDGANKIYDSAKDKITVEQTDGYGQISLLSLYTGTETEDQKAVVYQVIKATVLPESATDKSTTWEVYWIDNQTGNEDAPVTDYVTIMACTDAAPYMAQPGSNYCKVTCKQPFEGSTVGVRVTTAIGGFTAACKVSFVGKPSYLGLHEILEEGGYRHVSGQQTLEAGSETSYVLELDNVYHYVSGTDRNFEIVSVTMMNGSIKANKMFYNTTGTKLIETIDNYDISSKAGEFVTATLDGDVLTVKVERAIESWVGDSVGSPSGGNYYEFAGYAETGKPYFAITVRDTVSEVANTLYFGIESVVASVSLSDSIMTF